MADRLHKSGCCRCIGYVADRYTVVGMNHLFKVSSSKVEALIVLCKCATRFLTPSEYGVIIDVGGGSAWHSWRIYQDSTSRLLWAIAGLVLGTVYSVLSQPMATGQGANTLHSLVRSI